MDRTRRAVLALAAGSIGATLLGARAVAANASAAPRFASCVRLEDGLYGVAFLDEAGVIRRLHPLPDRGHDIAFDPVSRRCLAFARRPGDFAVVFDLEGHAAPVVLPAAEGRTFYGHGVFSPDGDHLYATENDPAAGRGMIGVYEARNGFRRVGEFGSGGVGPHELVWAADRKKLVVANGGIDTSADFGRAKLNVADMNSSLALLDVTGGRVLATERLGEGLSALSIRHLAADAHGAIWFGCQHEGDPTDLPPLAGRWRPGRSAELMALPEDLRARPKNYVGSVAVSGDGDTVAFSAPRGGLVFALSTTDGRFVGQARARDACGLAPSGSGLMATTGTGRTFSLEDDAALTPLGTGDVAFDNHLARLA